VVSFTHDDIKWAVKGSLSVPQRELRNTLKVAEDVVNKVDESMLKTAILSLIGLWGKPYGTRWKVAKTTHISDVGNVTVVGTQNGEIVLKTHTVMIRQPLLHARGHARALAGGGLDAPDQHRGAPSRLRIAGLGCR
jgi:hypothetical protein